MKPALLFLCHRIPYPPNKGDKIRSWHLLKHFCQHYRVFLAAFVDDPADWAHSSVLEEHCEDICLLPLNPRTARLRSIKGFLTGQALTVPYYYSSEMEQWIQHSVKSNGIERLVAYSSSMAQYALHIDHQFVKKMIDFVDIDSDKWLQYAENKPWPLSWVYQREARELHRFERRLTDYFDASLFVSAAEAQLFREMMPTATDKIDYFNNGVDTVYFSPDIPHASPYEPGEVAVVFTGAMDYWPNVDAVTWFAKEVFPAVLNNHPNMRFYIVGSNPSTQVQKLASSPGIVVTGTVDDVRPYLQHALAAIAPMRIARGVQNKVLEAMAMAKAVIVTEMGLEGINATSGSEVLLADEPGDYLLGIKDLVDGKSSCSGMASRERVIRDFSWGGNLASIEARLEGCAEHSLKAAVHV